MPINKLREFIYNEKVCDSSKWVLLRVLFIFADKKGMVSYDKFIEHFYGYYLRRLDSGLALDKDDAEINRIYKNLLTPEEFFNTSIFKDFKKAGFIDFYKEDENWYLYFSNGIWPAISPGEKVMILASIEDKLEYYFTHKVVYPEGALPVPCVFCQKENLEIVKENQLAFTVFDILPAVPGHCLVIPKRHVRDIYGLLPEEIGAMLELLKEMKVLLDEKFKPDGYNIGFNVGYAAGQTIMHAHMHCFPRKWGDVENPRGGMRNIIPNWFRYTRNIIGK